LQVAERIGESGKGGKTIDWEWVRRAVGKSAPPRLYDLESHIRFAKKWGGGVKQVFVRELVAYLNLKIGSRRQRQLIR